jgi:hypothetical protein
MKAFVYGLVMLSERPPVDEIFLDAYLLLYDMLNDDEEELRDVAAVTASLMLSHPCGGQTKSLSLLPTASSFHLAAFLAKNYASSPLILREAIRRFLGRPPAESARIDINLFVPVSTFLSGYRERGTALFAEEKQNLFVDDAREARIWATVLSQMVVADTNIDLLERMYTWALDGLLSLAQTTLVEGVDGIFGWISSPEVFTIGLRVIQATRVLLLRDGFGSRLFDRNIILKRLEDMLEAGRKATMHEQWLSLLQSTLDSNPDC